MTMSHRSWWHGFILAAVCAAVVAGSPRPAAAEAQSEVSHPFKQVWPAALRFLRVDAGFPILEKDAEAGYVLFEVKEERKTFRGALEVVRTKDAEGRAAVRLVLRIEDRPTYMEQHVLERLERKLRDELGSPPPPPPPTKPAE